MQETLVRFLGREDPLEKGKATHSSVLAWRIPWTIVHGVAKSRTRLSDFHFTYRISENVQDYQVLSYFHPLEIQRMKFF